jgi:hypothetical protein
VKKEEKEIEESGVSLNTSHGKRKHRKEKIRFLDQISLATLSLI